MKKHSLIILLVLLSLSGFNQVLEKILIKKDVPSRVKSYDPFLYYRQISLIFTNADTIYLIRNNENFNDWTIKHKGENGNIKTNDTENYKSWIYAFNNQEIVINSTAPEASDWYGLISWKLNYMNKDYLLQGYESDCMSYYCLLKKWVEITEENNYGALTKQKKRNKLISLKAEFPGCKTDKWLIEERKLPPDCNIHLKTAISFISVISLPLREAERYK